MNNRRGYVFEEVVARELEKQGYQVELTPKSRDFGVDIIARKGGRKIAIQVKNTKKPVGVKAVQEVVAGKRHYKCNEAWVVSKSGFTKNAVELARDNKVELVDWREYGREYNEVEWDGKVVWEEDIEEVSTNSNSGVGILISVLVVLIFIAAVYFDLRLDFGPTDANMNVDKIGITEQERIEMVLPAMIVPEIQNKTVLFFDDFERYKIGYTMGQQNGWFPIGGWYGKVGEQKVVQGISVSGNKSFQLWGDSCVNAGYHRYLEFDKGYLRIREMANSIGFETYIGIEGYGGPDCDDKVGDNSTAALLGFWNSRDGKYYVLVVFKRDGRIYANGRLIGRWEPKKWYHVRIVMNWQKGVFDVFLNGEKVGASLPVNKFEARYWIYDGIIVGSGHAAVRVFYDDFMIFMTNG